MSFRKGKSHLLFFDVWKKNAAIGNDQMNWTKVIAFFGGLVAAGLFIFAAGFAVLWGILPFLFYGKVVDTDGKPVAGAFVEVSVAVFPYSNDEDRSRYTDEHGVFRVWGVGAGLNATASAPGYYSLRQSLGIFGRGDDLSQGNLSGHLTEANAAVLELRKMGVCEPLIHISTDVQTDAEGTPKSIDLSSGRTYRLDHPDVIIQLWAPANAGTPGVTRYDWTYAILVPGGGIQARKGGDFDFMAPEAGYQSEVVVEMSAANLRWNSSANGDYFLKLKNGRYARVAFIVSVGSGNQSLLQIDSCLNPQPGHRNLEFDSRNQIKTVPSY